MWFSRWELFQMGAVSGWFSREPFQAGSDGCPDITILVDWV